MSHVATPITPFRFGRASDQPTEHHRGVVSVGERVEHPRRALASPVARIGYKARKRNRASPGERLGALAHLKTDLPVAGVVAERDRLSILAAHPAERREHQHLAPVHLARLPAHPRVLRKPEQIARRRIAQKLLRQRKLARRAVRTRCHIKEIVVVHKRMLPPGTSQVDGFHLPRMAFERRELFAKIVDQSLLDFFRKHSLNREGYRTVCFLIPRQHTVDPNAATSGELFPLLVRVAHVRRADCRDREPLKRLEKISCLSGGSLESIDDPPCLILAKTLARRAESSTDYCSHHRYDGISSRASDDTLAESIARYRDGTAIR